MQFTCAILIVSSRQNCRGHIMHHHDTFHKMLPPPAWHVYKQYRPGAETTAVNRPVPALKKNARPGANKKYNRPVPALKKHNHPVPSRLEKKIQPPRPASEKKTTAPSRLGKKQQPPRLASGKKTTAPSRLGKKKQPPRPASKKNPNLPVPPRILPRTIPSRPVPPRTSTPIFCQSRAPAEMKKVGQPSIFVPSRPVEILAVHVKPCILWGQNWNFDFVRI